MYYQRLLLLFLGLTGSYSLQAKEFPSVQYTQADGLPGNTVYSVFQDDEGYLWFSTSNGISRFNGVRFENFSTSDGLPDNECFFFRQDHYGRIWIGTFNGEPVFYKDGIFHTAKNTPYLRFPGPKNNTASILVEPDSSVTFFFRNKDYFVSVFKDRFKWYDLKKNIPYDISQRHIEDREEYPLNLVRKGPDRFRIVFGRRTLDFDSSCRILSRQALSSGIDLKASFPEFKNSCFYVTPDYILNEDLKPLRKIPLNGKMYFSSINGISRCGNRLFICTNHGLYLDDEIFFKGINVSSVFQDRDSNYWVGTVGKGVFKLQHNFYRSSKISGTYEASVVFAAKKDSNLVFSTRDRSTYIYRQERLLFSYDLGKRGSLQTGDYKSGQIIIGNDLVNIRSTEAFMIRDIHTAKPAVVVLDQMLLHNVNKAFDMGRYIYLQGRTNLDRVDKHRLLYVHKHKGGFPEVIFPDPKERVDNTKRIYGSALAPDSTIFFSTLAYVYTLKDTQVRRQLQFGNLNFKAMQIMGRYMIGITFDNRLVFIRDYDKPSATVDSSFSNNCVWDKFYTINDTALLISTNDYYRMICFPRQATSPGYHIRIVEHESVPLLADHIYVDSTECYFFKDHSIIKIPVAALFEKDHPPVVAFTGLQTAHREYPFTDAISLPFDVSGNIQLNYRLFSFNTKQVSAEYCLVTETDTNENWLPADAEGIHLLQIQPGTYTIKLRARTYAGSCSNTGTLILTVEKPFWQRWWFLLAMAGIAAAVILWSIRYFLRKKIRQKEKEIRIIKSEYQALNALMNPHFIFNSLNSVQGLINRDDKLSASEYVRTISDLIRQNMYNITGDFITMEKEMALVTNYLKLEQLRFKERLSYEITIDDCVEADLVLIPPLLIQPLVENALKYGLLLSDKADGQLDVCIYCEDTVTCIDVTDNGKGLSVSNSNSTGHQSTALNNIKKRLEHLFLMHQKKITLSITELKDDQGNIKGVCSAIRIYN